MQKIKLTEMETENKRIEFLEKNEAMDLERAVLQKQLKLTTIQLKRSESKLLMRMESDTTLSPERKPSGNLNALVGGRSPQITKTGKSRHLKNANDIISEVTSDLVSDIDTEE